MIFLSLLSVFSFSTCFYFGKDQFEEIVTHNPADWSSRDCLTVVADAIATNAYSDPQNQIMVFVTPYYPSVIIAMNRFVQFRDSHQSDETVRSTVDEIMKEAVGIYRDWETGKMYDGRGNLLRDKTQIDSLMLLVSLRNHTWPWFTPELKDMEHRILLLNDHGDTLFPKFIWGRARKQLQIEESYFVKYCFLKNGNHFLANSINMSMHITGFEHEIVLNFPLSTMK